MPFIIVCGVMALLLQLAILFEMPEKYRSFRYLSLLLFEALPLGAALYYAVAQPNISYLGWELYAAICLWIAAAILVGYLLAWAIFLFKKK